MAALREEAAGLGRERAALAADRDALEAVVGAAPAPMWRRAPDLGIVWYNSHYAALVGAAANAAGGGAAVEMSANARALARKAQDSEPPQREIRNLIVEGERRVY